MLFSISLNGSRIRYSHSQRVNRKLEMAVTPGDLVQAGVVISNSEVGLGAVSVQPLVGLPEHAIRGAMYYAGVAAKNES